MSCGIYKITNLITNKSYIGQSIHIEERWQKEKTRAFNPLYEHYDKILFCAFRKYGLENFTFEILEECDAALLDDKEKEYIEKYDTYFNGYNATLGGNWGNRGNSIKLTPQQVLTIYELLQNSSIPQNKIAEEYNVGQDVISNINHGKTRRLPGYTFPLRQNYKYNKCIDCGIDILPRSTRCDTCAKIHRRAKERPSREELKYLIRNKSFTAIGQQFGLSDNAIRKWCQSENLPHTKKAINAYSDEEWKLV